MPRSPVDQTQQQTQGGARVVGCRAIGAGGGHQLVHRGRREPTDAQVVEFTVGRQDREFGVPLPLGERREQPGVAVKAGVQRGLVGHGQRTRQGQPHNGTFLVFQQIQIQIQIRHVSIGVHLATQRDEPPPAHALRVDPNAAMRIGLVDLDHQHVTRIRFDVVVVRHLG